MLLLVPVALVAGIWLGGHPDDLPGGVRDTLVADSQGRLYDEAMDIIQRDYYRKVDQKSVLDDSLDAAVKSLDDRFSNYFSPKDYADFNEVTGGRFEGVGMTVEQDPKGLRIISVYKDTPAARGGLKPGDLIIAVNGKPLAGTSSTEATRSRVWKQVSGGKLTPVEVVFGISDGAYTAVTHVDPSQLAIGDQVAVGFVGAAPKSTKGPGISLGSKQ